MLDDIKEVSMLYDFYGELLPEKQREIFRLYHEDNYSLAEIGSEYGITRQGVHEAVKRSLEKLAGYEEKLGLIKRFSDTESVLETVSNSIGSLLTRYGENPDINISLRAMQEAIDRLEN